MFQLSCPDSEFSHTLLRVMVSYEMEFSSKILSYKLLVDANMAYMSYDVHHVL